MSIKFGPNPKDIQSTIWEDLRKPENINISEAVTSEFLSVLSGIAAD